MTQQLAPSAEQTPERPSARVSPRTRTIAGYTGLAVVFLASLVAPSGNAEYGLWSLLPALTLFGFILTTHRVLEGFLWAGVLAVFMVHRLDLPTAWIGSLNEQMTDPDNVWLLVLLTMIGGLLGVFERLGLSASFARAVSRLARGPRASGGITAVSSLLLSNDSYLSASGVGVSMTPVNRRFGLPRVFTASVVRSTGEPGTTLNPFGSTSVLIAGLLIGAGYGADRSEVSVYLDVLPYLFYSFAAVVIGVLLAFRVVPAVGAMRRAFDDVDAEEDDEAATTDGKLPHFLNFLVPIAVVIVSAIVLADIQLGFALALVVTGALLIAQRVTTITDYVDAVLDGMKDIFSLVLLMALAFVLVHAVSELGFTEFIIDSVGGVIAPQWLPFAIFLVFGITEMLVTLNWSLYILLVPVLVTLAGEVGASVPMTVAALLSAGTFGVAAAISSDVGLLTATSTRVPLYRHWITNLPYQIAAAVIALAGFAVLGILG
ncbi:Na+/H+ antiporter NhaC family protein [Microbacterium oryzae]|uniref:Na+/H+ antiporter NhaC family protein n=1 Tax=Microbacterium oryzae TaxID=743009 RepID=UPI0025B0F45C|nr:Na+/H+ antiporter NhaC family protein [Microbacterium oryzae]MDN3310613.1 Na+/H+ antiporter NhaC family protein [Microbacterium oryzae]